MATFYITFGQISPFKDGWVEIEAECEEKARELAFKAFGSKWAFIYSKGKFDRTYFPLGKVGNTLS